MGVGSFLSNLAGSIGVLAKKSLSSYCFLETADGEDTLVAKDGSLVSVIRIDGSRKMMGPADLDKLVEFMTTKLSPNLAAPGHALQFWFCRDPDLSGHLVRRLNATARNVAQNLDVDLEDVFAERERVLPRHIVHEAVYVALWTRVAVLSKQERQRLKLAQTPLPIWPKAVDTQFPFLAARQMTTRHRAYVDSFVENLRIFGIRSEVEPPREALRVIKSSIYPDNAADPWRPRLPGDVTRGRDGKPGATWARRPEQVDGDISHLLWPRIEEQLFDSGAEIVNQQIVRIGRKLFGSVDMTVGPQDLSSFTDLLNRLRSDEFPWRISFLIEGDGLGSGAFAMKAFLAGVAQVSNSDNKVVKDAIKHLSLYRQTGGVVPRVRISLATWAPGDRLDLAEERVSRLQKAVEQWGYCLASPSAGDPLAGVMSSALGLDVASTATPGLAELPDILFMLPWMRDASPFDRGSVLFRTIDGRPFPYEPGSDKQNTFIDIVFAPPGKGKSVWLNTTGLAFCLSPIATAGMGGFRLPQLAIIDIGGSSAGLISLIKEALPPERSHEVQFKYLRMVADDAINPFDTQLGCRKPLPYEKAFLVDFVTLLGTDASETKAARGLSDMAERAIDEVYDLYSDTTRNGTPRPYNRGDDPIVDDALDRHSIALTPEPSWWEVVDKLMFEAKAPREAALAQRHAVPLCEDLIQVVNTSRITDIFGQASIEGGEKLIQAFQRVVNSALRAYPILSAPTRFDVSGARVLSLDLAEAAPNAGGGPAQKQTAMVYMLARFIMARDYYLLEDNLAEMQPAYRNYHRARITRLNETPKRIVFDEFHRTSSSPAVRSAVVRDMREGRKYNVQIALASQMLGDFDKDMLGLATGFWIMGANEDQVADAKAKFNLSDTAEDAIGRYLHGPGKRGAPFLAVLQMDDGRHEHLLYNTLGPIELWAYSTTSEDKALRKRLYARLGAAEARVRLAKRFPGGTAKTEIIRRTKELVERGHVHLGGDTSEGIIQELANEIALR
jgi:intracellular multiplication protein IcmB